VNFVSDKKIMIRADGSHSIGLGHIWRMKTLSAAIRETGSPVSFLTANDPISNPLLKETGFPCYVFQPDSYLAVLTEAIQTHKPDLIIQDILETSSEDIKMIRQLSSAKIINFDDVGAGLILADAVINSMVFHWGKYNAEESRTRLFEGPQYMLLQSEISSYARLEKTIHNLATDILVAFGGTDTHFVTQRALQAINNVNMTPLIVKINLGPGSKMTPHLEKAIQESPHHITVIKSSPNLLYEFFNADIVLCAGGNMLYELAALGVPSVSIATEPHEIYNINYWSDIGTTIALGWEKNLTLSRITESLSELLKNPRKRTEMSAIGKQTIDDRGLSRVMSIIAEVLS